MGRAISTAAIASVLVLGLLASGTARGQSDRANAPGASRSSGAEYWRDRRFQVKVTFDGQVLDGEVLVKMLERETGAPLLLQGEWLKKPVGITVKDVPAAQLLDALAVLFNGRWHKVGEIYVLATSTQNAKAAVQLARRRAESELDKAAIRAGFDGLQKLVDSFTPEQWQKLGQQQELTARDLSPKQWQTLRGVLSLWSRTNCGGGKPTREALLGRGISIHCITATEQLMDGTTQTQYLVEFWWPNGGGPDPAKLGLVGIGLPLGVHPF